VSAPQLDPGDGPTRAHGLTAAQISEWTRRSRARQGLPARITDPVVLAKVVTLALGPTKHTERVLREDRAS
jgi:hypothetical protein